MGKSFKSLSSRNDKVGEKPVLVPVSKSTKRECDNNEPSVKRKHEIETDTVCVIKPKKSKSDQICEKKDKHKKHSVQGRNIQSEKAHSSNQKKEKNCEIGDSCSQGKSSDKSKPIARESDKSEEKFSKKAKLKIHKTVEFTASEANFEDCLGLNDIVIKKKKSSKPIQNKAKSSHKTELKAKIDSHKCSSSQSFQSATPIKNSSLQKEKLHTSAHKSERIMKTKDASMVSMLPQILPNYRPLPKVESLPKKKNVISKEDTVLFVSSKREKTAVYSGKRSFNNREVPSLLELSTRVLIDNIDCIEYVDCISYDLLKPVLEKCNPRQLLQIENYNPNLLEYTDELWEIHCKRHCKLLKLEENETYRELYLRAQDEREKKLKSITANISASMSKYNPARQVKLAYVDSVVKPPRDVARKQAKNGTSAAINPPAKADLSSEATPKPVASDVKPATASPVASVVKSASSTPPAQTHLIKTKPKVAPLMAKTLKSMKQCFRR